MSRPLPQDLKVAVEKIRTRWTEHTERPPFHVGKADVLALLQVIDQLQWWHERELERLTAEVSERDNRHDNKLSALENDLYAAIRRHLA